MSKKKDGLPVGLECRNGWYHYRRKINGKIHSKALRTKNLAYAVKMVVELNEQIEDKKVTPVVALSKNKVTLSEAAESYNQSKKLRDKTLVKYHGILKNLNKGFQELINRPETLISEIDKHLVQDYIHWRKTTEFSSNGHTSTKKTLGAAPKTIASEINLLKSIFKHALAKEWIGKIPILDGLAKNPNTRGKPSEIARPLSDKEIISVCEAARKYDEQLQGKYIYSNMFEAITKAFIYTGARHEEIKFLEWSDIDFSLNLIHMEKKCITCNRKIHLTPEALDVIQRHINIEGEYAFASKSVKVLNSIGYKLDMRAHDKLKGIKSKYFDFKKSVLNYKETWDWQPKASIGFIPIHGKLLLLLQELQKQTISNFVFGMFDGGYWRFKFQNHLDKITTAAGIAEKVRVHDLRHTTGFLLRRNGVALETIKEILRHADITETLRYAAYDTREGQAAINKLPNI